MPKSQLEWNVVWNEPITIAALTNRLYEEGAGKEDLVALLKARDRELCDQLCGPWYHPIQDGRYERAGSKKRKLGTRFGTITLKVRRVLDTVTGERFAPLWRDVRLDGRKVFQPDVIALAEQLGERMSYRNTREELAKVVPGAPSPRTINRRVIEDGNLLNAKIREREMETGSIMPDGTRLHAQKGNHHDVNITLAVRPGKKPLLRCLTVGEDWQSHQGTLERTVFRDEKGSAIPSSMVSDLERGLREAMTPRHGYWQADHVHVPRATGFALWEDGMELERRRSVVDTVNGLLSHLRNSVAYHLPRGEKEAVEHRIQQTTKEFRRLGTLLSQEGFRRAAKLLHRVSNYVTTFATLALQGITIPWNSNLVERLMGEVSKRCKHKWMSWTTRGSQALLTLLVTRTLEPETHARFFRGKLYGHLSTLRNLGIEVTHSEVGS